MIASRGVLALLLLATCIRGEDYIISRDDVVKQLVSHLQADPSAHLSEKQLKHAIEYSTAKIAKLAAELLPEQISAISRHGAERMLVHAINLMSDEEQYLDAVLPVWVSAVNSHVRFQRLYPALSAEGCAELEDQIALFAAAMRTLLLSEFGDKVDAHAVESEVDKVAKQMKNMVNDPNIGYYRKPIAKDAFASLLKNVEYDVSSRVPETFKLISLNENDPAHKHAWTNSQARRFMLEAVNKFRMLTIPPELQYADLDKLNPGHKALLEASGRETIRIFKKQTEREINRIRDAGPRWDPLHEE